MNGSAIQHLIHHQRRALVRILVAFGLGGITFFACDHSSVAPPKPARDKPSPEAAHPATALDSGELTFAPSFGSFVELQGTATIGSWSSRSTEIQGQIVLDTDARALDELFDRIQTSVLNDDHDVLLNLAPLSLRSPPIVDISVPVSSLHGDSGGMDRDMREALKSEAHPLIKYVFRKLGNAAGKWDSRSHLPALELRAIGTLTMAGVGRPITMDATVERDSRRHYHAHTQIALRMTDFGVTPPGKLFGLIKADDRVLVIFDLDFVLVNPSRSQAAPHGESGR